MKRLSIPFYPLLLISSFVFMSFMCKKDTITTVAFEATYTTSNELIDPPPLLKQRITGLGKSNELNISKFFKDCLTIEGYKIFLPVFIAEGNPRVAIVQDHYAGADVISACH